MEMTRRAFLTNPFRSVRRSVEDAGHWIRRAKDLAAGAAGTVSGAGSVAAARRGGLREARASMGRTTHEQL
jgi:hypothetical protein